MKLLFFLGALGGELAQAILLFAEAGGEGGELGALLLGGGGLDLVVSVADAAFELVALLLEAPHALLEAVKRADSRAPALDALVRLDKLALELLRLLEELGELGVVQVLGGDVKRGEMVRDEGLLGEGGRGGGGPAEHRDEDVRVALKHSLLERAGLEAVVVLHHGEEGEHSLGERLGCLLFQVRCVRRGERCNHLAHQPQELLALRLPELRERQMSEVERVLSQARNNLLRLHCLPRAPSRPKGAMAAPLWKLRCFLLTLSVASARFAGAGRLGNGSPPGGLERGFFGRKRETRAEQESICAAGGAVAGTDRRRLTWRRC